MRRFASVSLFTLLLAAGILACSESSTGPTEQAFSGSFTTAFDFIPLEMNDQGEPARASTPIQGDGSLTGLGSTTALVDQVVDFTVVPTEMSGTGRFVLSGGDEIHTTFEATSSFPDADNVVSFTGTHTVVGGTGRFEGAQGTAELNGTANLGTLSGDFTLAGQIIF